tara:strand:+ start:701 stop:883 length:183 start_codon:yes stop_codon:yes gene_type:complete
VTRTIGDKTLGNAPAFAKFCPTVTVLCDRLNARRYSKPHVKPDKLGYKNINKVLRLFINY